jgi:small GTP-binding protein
MQLVEKDQNQVDKFLKVCFVGSSGVGKTSLTRLLGGNDFADDVPSTVGYDFMFVDKVLGQYKVRFQFWDSAGQERYRAISPIHYKSISLYICRCEYYCFCL